MPFENTAATTLVALVVTWPLFSWAAYRALCITRPKDRIFLDRTLARRIAGVISGPFFWVFIIIAIIVVFIFNAIDNAVIEARQFWQTKKENPSPRTIARRDRWRKFLAA